MLVPSFLSRYEFSNSVLPRAFAGIDLELPGVVADAIDTQSEAAVRPLLRYLSRARAVSCLFESEFDALGRPNGPENKHVEGRDEDSHARTGMRRLVDFVYLKACLWLELQVKKSLQDHLDAAAFREVTHLQARVLRLLQGSNYLDIPKALVCLRTFYDGSRLAKCELGKMHISNCF